MTSAPRFRLSRSDSLRSVSVAVTRGADFDPLVREFLDTFYVASSSDRQASLRSEPGSLSPVKDAYLGAIAEHLALRFGLETPMWANAPRRFLAEPFFAGGMESLKPLLLVESPLAFRRRLIFISQNALSRPRDPEIKLSPEYQG